MVTPAPSRVRRVRREGRVEIFHARQYLEPLLLPVHRGAEVEVAAAQGLAGQAGSGEPPCAAGTVTARAGPSPVGATPSLSWITARAWSGVTGSVDLGRGRGALARLPEVRDLVLQDEEPVEERLRRRRAARHVDVHRHHAIHALHHVVAVAEGAPELAHEPMDTTHLGSGIWS